MERDKALFVRRGLQIVPASRLGWVLTLGYLLIIVGGSLVVAALAPAHGAIALGWTVLVLASAIILTIGLWRIAEVIAPPPHRDEDYWFVPKLFGLGATPVTWQGWALVLGTCALVALDMRFVEQRLAKLVVAAALIVMLIAISAHKTAGGWHWRWGPRD